MKKGESKVIKEFSTEKEMALWLANKDKHVEEYKQLYPPSEYIGKLNLETKQIIVIKK